MNQHSSYDHIVNSELQIQIDDEVSTGQVRRRALGPDSTTIGTYNKNPIFNLILYEFVFPYGQPKKYAANVIAKNMLSQVDSDGFITTLMESIIDR